MAYQFIYVFLVLFVLPLYLKLWPGFRQSHWDQKEEKEEAAAQGQWFRFRTRAHQQKQQRKRESKASSLRHEEPEVRTRPITGETSPTRRWWGPAIPISSRGPLKRFSSQTSQWIPRYFRSINIEMKELNCRGVMVHQNHLSGFLAVNSSAKCSLITFRIKHNMDDNNSLNILFLVNWHIHTLSFCPSQDNLGYKMSDCLNVSVNSVNKIMGGLAVTWSADTLLHQFSRWSGQDCCPLLGNPSCRVAPLEFLLVLFFLSLFGLLYPLYVWKLY